MHWQKLVARTALFALSSTLISCGNEENHKTGVTQSELSLLPPTTRQTVGPAISYAPFELGQDINSNMQTRRNHAWRLFERINQDVKVSDQWKVPVWQTWYDQEEFRQIFATLFNELIPSQRQQRAPFSAARVAQVLQDWGKKPRFMTFQPIDKEAFHQHRDANGQAFDGVQVGRTLFSPEFISHFLLNYKKVLACSPSYIEQFPERYRTPDAKNFSLCFEEEFPPAAVMIKAVFVRNDRNVSVFDSTPAVMKRTLSEGLWRATKEIPVTDIPHQKAFSVYFSDKSFYRLSALHVVTKEVREWIWATFWWSENPTKDFGADRDQIIQTMDPVFRNYKMCTVSHFVDGDKDPTRYYRDRFADLGGSLKEATNRFGDKTWCANPYLEGTFPKTNCIACHQHGGTDKTFDNSVTQKRLNFPSDFTFAFKALRLGITSVTDKP